MNDVGYRLQVADCRLQVANCRLKVVDCRLQTEHEPDMYMFDSLGFKDEGKA